nr:retrovirus-related Pol polyprotein from transposon TNT 1-94 [Tanacetum cinerariifolium]
MIEGSRARDSVVMPMVDESVIPGKEGDVLLGIYVNNRNDEASDVPTFVPFSSTIGPSIPTDTMTDPIAILTDLATSLIKLTAKSTNHTARMTVHTAVPNDVQSGIPNVKNTRSKGPGLIEKSKSHISFSKLSTSDPARKSVNFSLYLHRSSYARAMIVLRADVELKDTIVVAMPKLVGEKFYMCTIRVEYEWKPLRCSCCKVFGHVRDECPKKIVSDVVKNLKNHRLATKEKKAEVSRQGVSNSNPFDALSSIENDNDLGTNKGNSSSDGKGAKQLIEGKLLLVDDDGKPLPKWFTNSLWEQWKETKRDDDYNSYDDDLYDSHDMSDNLQVNQSNQTRSIKCPTGTSSNLISSVLASGSGVVKLVIVKRRTSARGPATLEHVAFCIVGGEAYCSTGFERRIVGCKPNPTLSGTGRAVWHGSCSLARVVQFSTDRVVWHELEQFSSKLNNIFLELHTVQRSVQKCLQIEDSLYQKKLRSLWQIPNLQTSKEYKNYLLSAKDRSRGRGYDRGQEAEPKQVEIMKDRRDKVQDKVVNIAVGDSDDALVYCVENTVEDHDKTLDIAGVGDVVFKTSFGTSWTLKDVRYIPSLKRRLISVGQLDDEGYHIGFKDQQWNVNKGSLVVAHGNKRGSMYMVERLGDMSRIGMSMLASKGNVPDVQKVDIYFCKPGGLGKQTNISFIMSVTTRKLPRSYGRYNANLQFGVAERLGQTFKAERTGLRVKASKMLWAYSSPGGSLDTSEGSKNNGSFEDSGRSDEEYPEDGASSKEGGFETL